MSVIARRADFQRQRLASKLATAQRAGVIVLMLAATLIGGCKTGSAQRDVDEALPKLADIRSDIELPPQPTRHTGATTQALVTRIALPLDQPTDFAWQYVDETVVPEEARRAWNDNGLRVGVMPAAAAEDFAAALPASIGVKRKVLILGSHPVAVSRSPRLRSRYLVELADVDGQAVNTIAQGHAQMLAGLPRRSAGNAIGLVPHHHLPTAIYGDLRREIELATGDNPERLLLEQELTGTMFDALALRVAASPSQIIVLGLYHPWPEQLLQFYADPAAEPADAIDSAEEPTPETPPAEDSVQSDEASPPIQPPSIEPNLGAAIFGIARAKQSLHTIVLIQPAP